MGTMKFLYGYYVILIISCQYFDVEGLTFPVSNYGAYPNDNIDDTNATQYAISAAIANGTNNIVLFQSGTYDFSGPVYIVSAMGLTVAGQGMQQTLLLLHSPTQLFLIISGQQITMSLFSVDCSPLPFTAGYVVSVTSTYLDLQVVAPHQADVGQKVGTILRYDPILMKPAIGSQAYEIYQTPPANVNTSLVSNNTLRIPLASPSLFAVGDAIVARYSFSIHVFQAQDVTDLTMQSLTVYASWYFSIYTSRARRLNMIDYHVKPLNGRWLSTAADCMHFGDSREYINIFDSSCEAQGDDGLNVQAFYFQVKQILNSTTMIIQENNWPDTLNVGVGTTLEFSTNSTPFSPYATATVTTSIVNNSNTRLFTFNSSVNATVGDMVCVAEALSLNIRNLSVTNNRARGALLSTRNVQITQSLFNGTSGPAILFQPSLYWNEGPAPRNVTLSQNVYINCNQGLYRNNGVIAFLPYPVQLKPVMFQAQITSSTFYNGPYSGSMVQCTNIEGVLISGNYLASNNLTAPVVLCNSKNISAYGNSIVNNTSMISQYYSYDTTSPCQTNLSSSINLPASAFNSSFPPPVIATTSGVQVNIIQNYTTMATNSPTMGMNATTMGMNNSTMPMNPTTMGMNNSTMPMNPTTMAMNNSTMPMNPTTMGMNNSTMPMNPTTMAMNNSTMPMNPTTMAMNSPTMGMNNSTMAMNSPTMGMNSPTMGMNATTMAMNSPTMGMNSPTMGMNSPTMGMNATAMAMNSPTMGMNSPTMGMNSPTMGMNSPTMGMNATAMAMNSPTMGMNSPTMGMNSPTMGMNSPTMGMNATAMAMNSPTMGMNNSTMAMNSPTMGMNATTMAMNSPTMGMNSPTMGMNATTMAMNSPTMGMNSPTMGMNATAMAMNSPTMGMNNSTMAMNSPTMGMNSPTMGMNATAMPMNSPTMGMNPTTMHMNNSTMPMNSPTMGMNATAMGMNATTMAMNSPTMGMNATTMGMNPTTMHMNNSTMPMNSPTMGMNATAMGMNATTMAMNSPTMGMNATTMGMNPTTMHMNNSTMPMNSPTMGMNATTMGMNPTTMHMNNSTMPTNSPTMGMNATTMHMNNSTMPMNSPTMGMNPTTMHMNNSTMPMNSPTMGMNPTTMPMNSTTMHMNNSTMAMNSATMAMNNSTMATNLTTMATNSTTMPMNSTTRSRTSAATIHVLISNRAMSYILLTFWTFLHYMHGVVNN